MLSHFIEFSGVTCPNLCWITTSEPAVKRFWSVATPKYCFPRALNLASTLVDPAAEPVVVRVVVERVVAALDVRLEVVVATTIGVVVLLVLTVVEEEVVVRRVVVVPVTWRH